MPSFPKWRPAPEALAKTFAGVVPSSPGVEPRKMFGYPACFVNGNMFMGLWQDLMVVRLAEADRLKLTKMPGASIFEPMPGRPMREYVVVPPSVLSEPKALRTWVGKALAFASELPKKAPKSKTRPAAKKRAR
jgi:TfoX/Sxy family transcriptional regulator of competence genes